MCEKLFSVDSAQIKPFEGEDSIYVAGNKPLIPILIPAPKPIKIVFEGQWQLENEDYKEYVNKYVIDE